MALAALAAVGALPLRPHLEIKLMKRLLCSAALVLSLAACSSVPAWMGGASAPAKTVDGVLVAPNGMTLYTFDRDTAGGGASACNGPCATNWPPLMAAADAKPDGNWSIISRDGGGRQWAYKGKPVYFWAKDAKAGDRTGDGFNGVWKLARP
jgi:predicted lipoprotein with Yx(FWY)xxD motif